jgi:hypothetical protein
MSGSTLAYEPDTSSIPGYGYGQAHIGRSPVSLEELRQIEQSAGWTEDDARILRKHRAVFTRNAERMVDTWRAAIASQPHLAKSFFGPDGKPDEEYKAKVKRRFVQWVVDACEQPHDQAWLDYQEEIGLRHTPGKKNVTDGAQTPPVVPLRYLAAFVPFVTVTARKFFADAGVHSDELQQLHDAWTKAVQLHFTLWTRPYVRDGLW